jgi:hypothetical protein
MRYSGVVFPLEAVIQHRDSVADRDRNDLIAALAALQLVPENADRLLRLEGGVQTVASLAGGQMRRVTRSELSSWLAATPFALGEDPFNNAFVEELPFVGGSYRVLPGLMDGSAYLLRRLGEAIFLGGAFGEEEPFLREAGQLVLAGLRVSDRVCRASGLVRGMRPGSGQLVIPQESQLAELRRAVTLDEAQLAEALAGLHADALAPLTQDAGLALTVNPEELGDGPFYARPLIRLDDGAIVVALPHALLGALLHAVVSLAVANNVVDRLASAFRSAIFASVIEGLSFIECPRIAGPASAAPDGCEDAVCFLDRDKALYVLVVTDPLDDYDLDRVHGRWADDDLAERIETRLLEVETELLVRSPAPNAILHLVIVQSLGRSNVVGFGPRPDPVRSYRLVMSAADLDAICLLDGGHELTLWQYARAADRLREHTHVFVWNELDEFDIYRRNRDYYLSDEERPNVLSIQVGGAAAILADVADERDFHGARTPSGGFTEVTLLHGERSIPICVPFPPGRRVEVLVEGLPLQVWVTPATDELDRRYRPLYAQFADFISYWVWQVTAEVRPWLEQLSEEHGQLLIELVLVENEAWFAGAAAADEPFEFAALAPDRLRLTFRAAITTRLAESTNAGERAVVAALVRAIAAAAGVELNDGDVTEIVDLRAPLGQKKKITILPAGSDPRLDDSGLPAYRPVQSADTSELLDELGAHLVHTLGHQVGPLEGRDTQRNALNAAVEFHFRELEKLVATIKRDELLDWLVVYHETIVSHQAMREFQVPSELACFSTSRQMVDRLRKEIPAIAQAAISSRFLIEYAVATQPSGIRPMSLAVYDRLLALASEIFNRGTLSDLIHYKLAEADISILASERLGVDQATVHRDERERFLGVHATAELEQRISAYPRTWSRPVDRPDPPEELQTLDEAVEGELGVKLTELVAFHIETINCGSALQGEPKALTRDELQRQLVEALGWEEERIARALELSTLTPRDNFFTPPEPFKGRDVYPWRFDRPLSYSRRPLLRRAIGDGDEIVWGNRHLYAASRYFFGLCTNGHLEAETLELRQVMSRRRSEDARAFNDRVAELLGQYANTIVKTRVTRFGRLKMEKAPGQLISDIDVLVADVRRRTLFLVETKDLAVARTPAELANELEELYRGRGGDTAAVDRLIDVASWVQRHRRDVLASLGINTSGLRRWRARQWRVRPLVVVDQELLTPYLVETVPTYSYRALRELFESGQLLG